MAGPRVLFSRRYRAAMLDYLLGSGETGLAQAYELGRGALCDGLGPLQILCAHQQAINVVLESAETVKETIRRLKAAEEFFIETLASFEMSHRGYVDLVGRYRGCPPNGTARGPRRRS